MKLITAEEARGLSGDKSIIAKRKFIEDHEKLLNEIFTIITDSCNNLKYYCTLIISKDRIDYLESEILRMILIDWGYNVNILPNYISSYAFEIDWGKND